MNDNPNKLRVDNLTPRTVIRALQAPETTRTHLWSNAAPTNRTLFAANHFNDPEQCLGNVLATVTLVSAFSYYILKSEKYEMISAWIQQKDHQMGDLFAIVCHQLRDSKRPENGLTILALANDQEITIRLIEVVEGPKGAGVNISFDDDEEFASNEKLIRYTANLKQIFFINYQSTRTHFSRKLSHLILKYLTRYASTMSDFPSCQSIPIITRPIQESNLQIVQ